MATHAVFFSKLILTALLLPGLVLPEAPLAAQTQAAATRQWKARHVLDPKNKSVGPKVTLTLAPERIAALDQKGAGVTIPVEGVEAVIYNTDIYPMLSMDDYMTGALNAGPGGAFLAFLLMPVAIAVSREKSTDHFVTILWKEGEATHEAIFQVDKGEYREVLRELERLTGRKYRDVPAEIETLRKEISHNAAQAHALNLDRCVTIGSADLDVGLYQIVLLEREPGRGDLFFFRGKEVKPEKAAAQARVEIESLAAARADARAGYRREVDFSTVTEVQLPQQTLRLETRALPGDPKTTAERIYDARGWWVLVRHDTYDGEPALRVGVIHDHTWSPPCEGMLYVTPTRVAYEPQSKGAEKDRFVVARGDVRTDTTNAKGMPALQIAAQGRKFALTPIVERGDSRRPIAMSPIRKCGASVLMFATTECGGCDGFVNYLRLAIADFAGVARKAQQ